jgi:hypothetical protein
MCNDYKIPKKVHVWDVQGYVRLNKEIREKLKIKIKKYGVRKLSRDLNFDRETIYSIYTSKNKKRAHSIPHLISIVDSLGVKRKGLEKEITHYGSGQANMYKIHFPFFLEPLTLRSVTIHGDGSFFINTKKNGINAEWYQKGNNSRYMEKLLKKITKNDSISCRLKSKIGNVFYISIPTHLVRLTCKSLNIGIKDFYSIEFFKAVSKLSYEYKMQVFFQFIFDEGHFKDTTLTVSQKKEGFRTGFKILLDSLNFDHSDPTNDKDDITIYNYNFPIILDYLKEAKREYGLIAGLWAKEKEFIEICKKINPSHYPLIRKSMNINKEIFNKLKMKNKNFCYQDIRDFGRTSSQANKAIRCWKKNNLIERVGWNNYRIL